MNDIREDLKAFLDGELSPPRAAEVQTAIDSDPALQQEVEFMKALGFEIKKMKHEPAVAGAEETMAKLRRKPRAWWMRPEPYVATAMCALLVAVFFPVYAQSKFSARKAYELSMEKRQNADTGVASSEAPASAPSEGIALPNDAFAWRGGGGGGGLPDPTLKSPLTRNRVPFPTRTLSGKADGEQYSDKSKPEAGERGGVDGTVLLPGQGRAPSSAVIAPRSPQLLIRTADLHRRVEDVAKAQSETIKLANANGGFLASNSSTGSEGQLPEANITIRVPVKRFDSVCEAIRAMGTNVSDNTNTDDVTAQVADTEARLKVMRAEEDSYVTMLRATRKVGELLEIKERLSSVRQEIESLDAQRKALRDQSSYSTINAVFTQKAKIGEPETPKNWSEDTWTNAVNGLTGALRWLGQVVITVFVYSPLWLPVLLIGWWLSRKARK